MKLCHCTVLCTVVFATLAGPLRASSEQSARSVEDVGEHDALLLGGEYVSSDTSSSVRFASLLRGSGLSSSPIAEPVQSRAARQLKQQEHQRILGLIPEFNTSNVQDAAPLSAGEKFELALKGSLDPFAFVAAGLDAGSRSSHSPYGSGLHGYQKRFEASYADSFDGAMLGNALFPALMHQDPRYFRKGRGSFRSRIVYSILTTIRCRDDSGKWVPNYSNVFGNFAAGSIANLYYPSSERGAGLTIQRALTVTAEGSIGAAFDEFWPDISRRVFHKP